MQTQAKSPAFDDFYHLLTQAEVATSPAEIHGMLCGFVCVGPKLNGGFLIDILLKRLETSPPLMMGSQGAVVGLYDAACRQLSGLQAFQLLLPDEQHELEERAEALSLWCEGFLYGLGLGGGSSIEDETPDVIHEALYCIAEIARLEINHLEVTALDKLAYDEAIEFITHAIPLIYEELIRYSVEGSSGFIYLH